MKLTKRGKRALTGLGLIAVLAIPAGTDPVVNAADLGLWVGFLILATAFVPVVTHN